ncbi:acyltransferase [Shewanella cyperi]|uniref:Acyltransferase n=1 Tax=Shewanella cyperi TaxID=2814292 RepID=A0A974XMN3_9GAMM|nr:acyltransferase [Shewanella cyperi]QSX31189.1 acyltransferase [Shewanella cyperi]
MTRLPGLDLLRAIAIVWVVLFHTAGAGLSMPFRDFSILGWMGVDLFFVLSGFLIGEQLLKQIAQRQELNIGKFYISRAFRILPAYAVFVLLYFLLPFTREGHGLPPLWQFLSFSVNLQVDVGTNTFSHVWSLCVEEHFYLFFPLIVWLLMNRSSTTKVVALAIAIIGFGMALRGHLWLTKLDTVPVYRSYVENIYYPTYNRLDGLLAGGLLAALKVFKPHHWELVVKHGNKVLLAGLAGLGLAIWIFKERFGFTATVIGFPLLSFSLAFIVAAASSTNSLIGKFKVPGAALLATLAYSMYLTHKSIFQMVKTLIGPQLVDNDYLAFVVYGGAVLAGAAILYLTVERPFLKLRSKYLARNQDESPRIDGVNAQVTNG